MRLPIMAGPLRGRWWNAASGGKVLRVLGGSYEPAQTELFSRMVAPGGTVLDVGAHVGYYTLLAAVRVGPAGAVVALEPDPRNAKRLRAHVVANGFRNVRVMPAAVSDRDGEAHFAYGSGTGTGRLSSSGELVVPTIRLDTLVREQALAPTAVKVDVEGAEVAVLTGAQETLRRYQPAVFLSVHSAELLQCCLTLMQGWGYRVRPIDAPRLEDARELLCTAGG